MKKSKPKERDVIIVQVGSSQEQNVKSRPAICLRKMPPTYQEFLVCGLSSNLTQHVKNFDEKVTPQDDNLKNIQCESVIRLGFLDRVRTEIVQGSIGSISVERHRRLLKKLSDYLVKRP